MKYKLTMILCALAVSAWSQVTFTLGCPGFAKAGAQVTCSASVSGTPVATQSTINIISGGVAVPWTMTTALTGKQLGTSGLSNIFLIYGMNATPIPNGTMASIVFTMPNGTTTVGLTPASSFASDPSGGGLTVTTNPPLTVALQSNCDINGDGVTNVLDVSTLVNQVLAGGSSFNVTAVQKVINAALGGACTL